MCRNPLSSEYSFGSSMASLVNPTLCSENVNKMNSLSALFRGQQSLDSRLCVHPGKPGGKAAIILSCITHSLNHIFSTYFFHSKLLLQSSCFFQGKILYNYPLWCLPVRFIVSRLIMFHMLCVPCLFHLVIHHRDLPISAQNDLPQCEHYLNSLAQPHHNVYFCCFQLFFTV